MHGVVENGAQMQIHTMQEIHQVKGEVLESTTGIEVQVPEFVGHPENVT